METKAEACRIGRVETLNLDIFWLKDDALEDPDLPPPPDEVAAEVVETQRSLGRKEPVP